jgi:hypothetical protein
MDVMMMVMQGSGRAMAQRSRAAQNRAAQNRAASGRAARGRVPLDGEHPDHRGGYYLARPALQASHMCRRFAVR